MSESAGSGPELASSRERDALVDRLKAVHRSYMTGVSIVTVVAQGQPYGLAVSAFASVSLTPPLVLFCISTAARSHVHLFRGEHAGINILAHDQAAVAAAFAMSGGDKFLDLAWHEGQSGVPVLDGVSSYLEVRIQQRLSAGTHTIFIGEVIVAEAYGRPPLLYHDGSFFDGAKLQPVPTAD